MRLLHEATRKSLLRLDAKELSMEIDPTYLIVDQKECKRLHKEGMSTRKLAEHFKVPLRQIQNALDLEQRKKWDRDWSKKRRRL